MDFLFKSISLCNILFVKMFGTDMHVTKYEIGRCKVVVQEDFKAFHEVRNANRCRP